MKYSTVCSHKINQTPDLRIDAKYWRPSFIKNSKLISESKRIKHYVSHDISNIKSSPINKNFEYLEISGISLNNLVYNTDQIQKEKQPDRAYHILKKMMLWSPLFGQAEMPQLLLTETKLSAAAVCLC